MKKLLMFCSTLLLSACFNEHYDFKGKEFNEPVEAILIETDKVYFLGSNINAVFDKTLVDNTKASDVIIYLNKLLKSPYAKKVSEHLIHLSIYDENIEISYTPKIKAKDLSENDIRDLQKLGFEFSHSKEFLFKTYARLAGKMTKFTNRAEMLAKYKLEQPIIAKATSYQKKTEFSLEDTVAAIATPITIPIGAIIMLPLYKAQQDAR